MPIIYLHYGRGTTSLVFVSRILSQDWVKISVSDFKVAGFFGQKLVAKMTFAFFQNYGAKGLTMKNKINLTYVS